MQVVKPKTVSGGLTGRSSCYPTRRQQRLVVAQPHTALARPAHNTRLCSSTSAGLLEGASAAAQDVGELLLRRWVGVNDEGHLPVHEETAPLRDTECDVTICATIVTAGQRKHVLMAIVVTDAAAPVTGKSSSSAAARRSSGFKLADLPKPMLHWGCVAGKGDRWQPPPSGWSTWPDVSHDARHGAWQTPFVEQELPGVGPALTLMLQLPWDGPMRHGGLAFLIKTRNNKWLGNAATYKDFFFATGQLPEMPLVSAPSTAVGANSWGLVGPDKTLDADRLAKAPPPRPPTPPTSNKSKHDNNHHHHQEHHEHRHASEPELPNAGRREKEPARDDTQVCTLTARELRSAAAAQLGAWMQQQPDLEVPLSGLEVVQHEFPVQGHPSTPFAVATTVMLQRPSDATSSEASQPVLLVAALADVGVTGTRRHGLVLQWAGAATDMQSKPGAPQPQAVADVPRGWKTLPDLTWDAGAGHWDTPMSRHLFEGGQVEVMGQLERSVSPTPDGNGTNSSSNSSNGSQTVRQSAEASGMYMALLRLPLQGVLTTGGLLLSMRTARRQWVRHAETDGAFFLDTAALAQRLGFGAAAQAPGDSSSGGLNPNHKALLAAGLSESEIISLAAKLAPADSAAAAAASTSSSSSRGSSIGSSAQEAAWGGLDAAASVEAALSSADQEMQAHIAAQSLAVEDKGSNSNSTSSKAVSISPTSSKTSGSSSTKGDTSSTSTSAGLSKKDLAKFLKDFEMVAVPADDMLWGLQGAAALHSDAVDIPELPPNDRMVRKLADAEHKACRSLMHRYNIAADLVQELLPGLRAAAASAPESLTWPTASSSSSTASKGAAAMSGLVAVTVWLRFSSLRLLTWNHNYNVKPREISAALDRLGASLVEVYESCPQLSGLVLLALASAGRGGEGDMGQRIRDEILAIQQRNHCKGGMMEEWHQKLHNNSSPDDLAICQALLDYLAAGQQLQVYWDSLAKEGITAERLASYDRPIRSAPPTFSADQVPRLTEDLIAYRRTLAAVHSGADLSAAIDGVLGYDAGECKGKRVKVEPLEAVATPKLRQLLGGLLMLVQTGSSSSGSGSGSSKVTAMVEMDRCLKLQALVVQARHCLAPALRGGNKACQGRLRDVLFLDLALEMTGKGALEAGLAAVRAAAPSTLLGGLLALLQQPLSSACMSALPGQGGSAAMVGVAGQLAMLSQDCPGLDATAKARHALSLMERTRSALASLSGGAMALLQPTANSLAGALGLSTSQGHEGPVPLLAEEVVRGSAAAALSLLLTAVEPSLRRLAGVGAWSVVSRLPSTVKGTLSPLTPCLSQLPAGGAADDTILVLQRLAGEEEVPVGVVGVVVLGDCPDVLSHCAVRARNCKIPVVACPSSEEAQVSQVVALAGKRVELSIKGDEVLLTEVTAAEEAKNTTTPTAAADGDQQTTAGGSTAGSTEDTTSKQEERPAASPKATLIAPPASAWDGDWVLTVDKFEPGAVGQKAMSTTNLHKAATAAAAAAAGSSAASTTNSSAASSSLQQLPAWVKLPASVALPHGSFEAVLRAPLNRDLAAGLQELAARIAATAQAQPGNAEACAADLDQIRAMVQQLQVPPGLIHNLSKQLACMASAHAASGNSNGNGHSASYAWEDVWSAIKGVWASQWNSRAVAALGKAGLPLLHLRMGVLLQPLLPAHYSWVAHTVNPATGSADEVCVQLVVGLGEALVGNHPGRALGGIISRKALMSALKSSSSTISSNGNGNGSSVVPVPVPGKEELLAAVDVVSYPSKGAAIVPVGLQLPSCGGEGSKGNTQAVFMARSDSNAEDLPGFAGAGLFDSVPTAPTNACLINYIKEPMAWDKAAAAALLWQCALAAVAAEEVLQQQEQEQGLAGGASTSSGAPVGLDVEGCITVDGSMWLLQARPQV